MLEKPGVEVYLMQRHDRTQYFEVWVRSENLHNGVRIRNGSIVERQFGDEVKIEITAGAIAEGIAEKYSDPIDPGEAARAARQAFLELNSLNPRPVLGDEEPL